MLVAHFIDPTAEVDPTATVWHYAVLLSGAKIGARCMIGSYVEVGRNCVIGDGSRIGAHSFLPPNTVIGKDVFIGPGLTCADNKFARVTYPMEPPMDPPTIGDGASIGTGVVLMPGVRIGVGARIAAGSLVTHDVPDHTAVRGSPAREFPMPPEWRHDG